MSGKRQAEGLEETSPAKRQRVSNGAAINGGPAEAKPPQKPALPALQAIAKAKQALELQKQLKAKLAAAGITVVLCSKATVLTRPQESALPTCVCP